MRIRLYPINQNLTNSDTLLGTDSGGLTKNFQLGTLAQFITSGINVSGATVVTSGGSFSLSATLNAGDGLSATSTQLSANPTIGLTTVGPAGSGTKISFDSFGRVVSASSLQEPDIPSLQPSKIQTTSANRFVTDTQIAIWNTNTSGISADLQSQINNISSTTITVGLDVQYTTNGNINLSGFGVQSNGSWNINLTSADRILVKDQTISKFNGVYTPSEADWVRVTDFNNIDNIIKNTYFLVTSGSEYNTGWLFISEPPYTIDDTPLNFSKVFDNNQTVTNITQSLIGESINDTIFLISGATSAISKPEISDAAVKSLSPIFSGIRAKTISIIGPTSGTYSATIVLYGANSSNVGWEYPDDCIIASIDNNNNSSNGVFINKFIVWGAQLIIDTGTIPYPGIIAKVEV